MENIENKTRKQLFKDLEKSNAKIVELENYEAKRKQTEEAMHNKDRVYRTLLNNLPGFTYRCLNDKNWTMSYISEGCKELTGYLQEDFINNKNIAFNDIIDKGYTQKIWNVWQDVLEKKTAFEYEYPIITKSGQIRWVWERGCGIYSDDGKLQFLEGFITDITERKQAEEELEKHREHLEEHVKERTYEVERSQKSLVLLLEDVNDINDDLRKANTMLNATNKELEAFTYSVSHDLRAPLTRMDGFSKALIDSYSSNLDDRAVHFLSRIRASSKHMAKLIDDLLSLSRITMEKVTRRKIDLSQTAGKITNELKASEPGRKVDFEITKGLSANADRKFVIIILENLLGNAFKFTGKKNNTIIKFGKIIINKEKVFFIKDNGDGFNMKYYDKIFNAFQRLHSDKEFPGSGIGLAIVQRIINKHGGKIWAESEEGKGATFYFRFE